MAEPHTIPRADDRAEETLALTPDLVRDILDAEDAGAVRAKLAPLHAADVADLLERIAPDERSTVLDAIRGALDPDILAELDETVRGEVARQMAPQELAQAVAGLDDDDAVEVVADLDEEMREKVLARLPQPDRAAVEQALAYGDDTVGRLMQRATVVVPAYWTVGETIDYLRADASLPDAFFDVFVVDPRHRPVGSLPLSRILRNRRPVGLADIMDGEPVVLPVAMDQEEAAFLFRQQDLTSAPVVDESGRLAGVLTIDDVVDVMDEEHEDDILKLGGVYEDDLYHAAAATAAKRFPWLLVNLGTAVLASVVIAQFEADHRSIGRARCADADRRLDGRQCRHANAHRRGPRARDEGAIGHQRPAHCREGSAGRRVQRHAVRRYRSGADIRLVRQLAAGRCHRGGHGGQPARGRAFRRGHSSCAGPDADRPGGRIFGRADDRDGRCRLLRLSGAGRRGAAVSAVIRPVRDSDADGLIRLIDKCWSAYEGCILDVDAEEPQLRAMRSHFDAAGGEFWVAEDADGRIVASGGWAPAAVPAGLELHKLYVLAECRRQGIAWRLVDMVEEAALRRGSRFVELWSDSRFLEAHAFYEALGYRRTGRTRDLNDLSNTTEFHFIKDLFTVS